MPFLTRIDHDNFEWSGDGPTGPLDDIPSRKMNRIEAAAYLRGHGEAEENITAVLNGNTKGERQMSKKVSDKSLAVEMLQDVVAYIVDYGKVELGTPQSRQLINALSLLRGEDMFNVIMTKKGNAAVAYLIEWNEADTGIDYKFSPAKEKALKYDGKQAVEIIISLRAKQDNNNTISYSATAA